ncbi:MAG: alanine dehydrogenase, partial [Planctomycetota bacterium]
QNPTYHEQGVLHYCVANMPGAYSRTATQALSNVTQRWVTLLADKGVAEANLSQPAIFGGINCMDGDVTCEPVAVAHDLTYVPPRFS